MALLNPKLSVQFQKRHPYTNLKRLSYFTNVIHTLETQAQKHLGSVQARFYIGEIV